MSANIVIIIRQVTTYHHARFEAAASRFDSCNVFSLANEGKFDQVLSKRIEAGYVLHRVYSDTSSYLAAAATGELEQEVVRRLDEIHPDIVAIPGWASPESFAAVKWAKRRRARIVLMSESQMHDAQRRYLYERIKSCIVNWCDAALVGGRSHREYLSRLGMPANRIFLGYNAVENDHFLAGADTARSDAAQHRLRLGLPDRYILASARFVPKKNLKVLVRAYGDAASRHDDPPCLLIAGDGQGRPALETLVDSLSLRGRVLMPGFFGYDDLPAVYGLSEAFVHVPLWEQWGLVINEAAAAGLPMLVSQSCGAASELIKDCVGSWRIDPHDASAIADGLYRLMTLSPEQRLRAGATNLARVENWGPARFADGLKAASECRIENPTPKLRLIDYALIRYLVRRPVGSVE